MRTLDSSIQKGKVNASKNAATQDTHNALAEMPLNGASASMENRSIVDIADACQREITVQVSPEPQAQLVGTVSCTSLNGL